MYTLVQIYALYFNLVHFFLRIFHFYPTLFCFMCKKKQKNVKKLVCMQIYL